MRRFPLIIFALLLTLPSCQKDEVDTATLLQGRWNLETALRNNMETGMLDGLYYDFGPAGQFDTNLMGNEKSGTFLLEETTVSTEGIVPALVYEITEITDSTMHLRTELQDYRFDFDLVRPAEAPGL